jgi:hypothetical protein
VHGPRIQQRTDLSQRRAVGRVRFPVHRH